MGFSGKFKQALKEEHWTLKQMAAEMGKSAQLLYNAMHTDGTSTASGKSSSMAYGTVEQMLDILGYDIVFRRRSDGKIID